MKKKLSGYACLFSEREISLSGSAITGLLLEEVFIEA